MTPGTVEGWVVTLAFAAGAAGVWALPAVIGRLVAMAGKGERR